MKNTVRMPICVLALMLVAPAFAATPADNVAWSTRSVPATMASPDCSAYSGWRIGGGEHPSTETVLKSVGTMLAVSALSVTTGLLGGSSTQSVRACRPANGS
ncbi:MULTISPECIES: hypothetical protein [Burkholderia cepacia complex]|uniref:Uncharacterized protein n=2 Tax=Burkholderia cepacia complex TaxID=87882 RepID=A0ABZ3BCA9_BURPY|nr:hypothetical protein [Burkholderia stabilis]BAX57917.1 hypothetical protein BSFP_007120 [Burkholderia stabilis]